MTIKTTPYWWNELNRNENTLNVLPQSAQVVIIGAGITGLNAALTLAKAGRNIVVVDKEYPGFGASSRNAGYLSKAHLHSLSTLIKKHGEEKAVTLVDEACKAFDFTENLIANEKIDCQYQKSGRIYWAYSEKQAQTLAVEHATLNKHIKQLNISSSLVGDSAHSDHMNSNQYCAGLSVPNSSTLHPGKYVQGLAEKVVAAGGIIAADTCVLKINNKQNVFTVETTRGNINATQVIVATNAYVGAETPYFRQRVVPVHGQMIALKAPSPELLDKLLPNHIAHLDVRAMFRYWRRSPDNTHVLFGSRTGFGVSNPLAEADKLKALLVDIFPELSSGTISHYWNGLLGGTMDQFPHLGCHNGVHFAMGMNGHGVPMGSYLGDKMALKLLGQDGSETAFDKLSFDAAPLIKGKAWFMPVISGLQALADKLEKPLQK